MQTYCVFLRGINVNGISIKMADLKKCLEETGFTHVRTVLQTGNVLFDSDELPAQVKQKCQDTLSNLFQYEAFVLIYTIEMLQEVVHNYPLIREEGMHNYVVFVETEASFQELKIWIDGNKLQNEELRAIKGIIYWKVAKEKTLDSPFSKYISKSRYKSTTTTRNINTLEKMLS